LPEFLKWNSVRKALTTNADTLQYTITSQLIQDKW
jgi:hypothetical protein